jgi:hypothetical protein
MALSDDILEEADALMSDPDWMRQAEAEFEQAKAEPEQQTKAEFEQAKAEPEQSGGASRKGFALSAVSLVAVVVTMAFA